MVLTSPGRVFFPVGGRRFIREVRRADAAMREAYLHELSSAGFWPGGAGIGYRAPLRRVVFEKVLKLAELIKLIV